MCFMELSELIRNRRCVFCCHRSSGIAQRKAMETYLSALKGNACCVLIIPAVNQ